MSGPIRNIDDDFSLQNGRHPMEHCATFGTPQALAGVNAVASDQFPIGLTATNLASDVLIAQSIATALPNENWNAEHKKDDAVKHWLRSAAVERKQSKDERNNLHGDRPGIIAVRTCALRQDRSRVRKMHME